MPLHYENIILIPSIIDPPSTPLTYSNKRSIYSRSVRWEQMKHSIHTARDKIPNSKIIVVECSALSEDETHFFATNVDLFINLYDTNDPDTMSKIYSSSKSMGEGTMTIRALQYLETNQIEYTSFFKLSGRYWLNEKFDYLQFENNSAIAKFFGENRYYANTVLYKLTCSQSKKWLEYLLNCNHHFIHGISYEHIFSMFLRDLEQIPTESVVDPPNPIGGCGYISVSGDYIEV